MASPQPHNFTTVVSRNLHDHQPSLWFKPRPRLHLHTHPRHLSPSLIRSGPWNCQRHGPRAATGGRLPPRHAGRTDGVVNNGPPPKLSGYSGDDSCGNCVACRMSSCLLARVFGTAAAATGPHWERGRVCPGDGGAGQADIPSRDSRFSSPASPSTRSSFPPWTPCGTTTW